ncbi:MAG TPA: helix-turn-helix transcriptional regulator [Chitinophagaceae bacterium]
MNIRNEEYIKAFGNNLKKLRTAKKLSREALAAETGIEPKQIYRIEVGETNPTISTIAAIAIALGVQPKKLFDFEFDFGNG